MRWFADCWPTKPLLRRLGNKWQQRKLFELFPSHRKLLDSHFGSGTASLYDFPHPGWAIDQDADLVNFFRVLMKYGSAFFHQLLTEFPGGCEWVYEDLKKIYASKVWPAYPPEWRAVAYYWLL